MFTQKETKSTNWSAIRRDGHIDEPAKSATAAGQAAAATGTNQTTAQAAATTATNMNTTITEPKNWKEFFDAQPEPIKKLYNEAHSALQNTIKATREERDTLKDQITEALKKAEKGSEFEKSLIEIQGKLTKEMKKSNFFEAGTKPEIGCTNLPLAFLVADTKDLFKKDGSPDWEAIKAEFPEGFVKVNNATNPAQKQPSLSATNPGEQNMLTKEAIEKMAPSEINKNWAAVQEFLKSQK